MFIETFNLGDVLEVLCVGTKTLLDLQIDCFKQSHILRTAFEIFCSQNGTNCKKGNQ